MKIIGVTFKNKGKVYHFSDNNIALKIDDCVILETERGLQIAKVVDFLDESSVEGKKEIKPIIRLASKKDFQQHLKNLSKADEALKQAISISNELSLKINFIDAQFTFDRKQLYFNFYADERVDFRELAKRLASIYRTRIELRQIGARDKAEKIGGIGICGGELCCSRFLTKMESVSMNMAKNQNLSLNPNKINGCCGRLLCCLTYENDEYKRCSKGMPNIGQNILTEFGVAPVVSIDILNRKCKVWVDNEIKEVSIEDESSK